MVDQMTNSQALLDYLTWADNKMIEMISKISVEEENREVSKGSSVNQNYYISLKSIWDGILI